MIKLSIEKIDFDDVMKGDYVLVRNVSYAKFNIGRVEERGRTFLHGHDFIKIIFLRNLNHIVGMGRTKMMKSDLPKVEIIRRTDWDET